MRLCWRVQPWTLNILNVCHGLIMPKYHTDMPRVVPKIVTRCFEYLLLWSPPAMTANCSSSDWGLTDDDPDSRQRPNDNEHQSLHPNNPIHPKPHLQKPHMKLIPSPE